jgi:hypothetical protein
MESQFNSPPSKNPKTIPDCIRRSSLGNPGRNTWRITPPKINAKLVYKCNASHITMNL